MTFFLPVRMESALPLRQCRHSDFLFRTLFPTNHLLNSPTLPNHISLQSIQQCKAPMWHPLGNRQQMLVSVDAAAGPKRKGLVGNIFFLWLQARVAVSGQSGPELVVRGFLARLVMFSFYRLRCEIRFLHTHRIIYRPQYTNPVNVTVPTQ